MRSVLIACVLLAACSQPMAKQDTPDQKQLRTNDNIHVQVYNDPHPQGCQYLVRYVTTGGTALTVRQMAGTNGMCIPSRR